MARLSLADGRVTAVLFTAKTHLIRLRVFVQPSKLLGKGHTSEQQLQASAGSCRFLPL